MPLPLIPLWVYASLMAAGTGAQMMAQKKVDNERSKAMAEERKKRMKLTAENEASAEKSKQLFANAQANENKRAAEMAPQIAAHSTQITTDPAGAGRLLDPNSAPSTTSTVAEAKDAFSQGDAQSAARAAAKAQAGAFGSVFQDYSEGLGRNAQDMDMNATTMRNWSQRVLPARLEYANQTGREWSTTGDVLKLIGTIMAPYALGGGNPAAETTEGVLDQMKGMPKEFAGKDLFGMKEMGIGGNPWTAGRDALIEQMKRGGIGGHAYDPSQLGMGGLVSSEEYSKALWKQLSGIGLSDYERQLLLRKQLQ